jgi:hypothetical protein
MMGAISADPYARIQQLSRESTAADDGFLAELSRQLCRIAPFEASFWAGANPRTLWRHRRPASRTSTGAQSPLPPPQ